MLNSQNSQILQNPKKSLTSSKSKNLPKSPKNPKNPKGSKNSKNLKAVQIMTQKTLNPSKKSKSKPRSLRSRKRLLSKQNKSVVHDIPDVLVSVHASNHQFSKFQNSHSDRNHPKKSKKLKK